jgi:hypothetical protein
LTETGTIVKSWLLISEVVGVRGIREGKVQVDEFMSWPPFAFAYVLNAHNFIEMGLAP